MKYPSGALEFITLSDFCQEGTCCGTLTSHRIARKACQPVDVDSAKQPLDVTAEPQTARRRVPTKFAALGTCGPPDLVFRGSIFDLVSSRGCGGDEPSSQSQQPRPGDR